MSDPLAPPPVQRLAALINGFQVSQAIHVAATLGIADLLQDGPRTADHLAAATASDPRSLYRLLRALASVDVFREEPDGSFALGELGESLRSDAPGSLAGWAVFIGRPHFWQTWDHLLHSVKTGENAFRALHDGQGVWEWRADKPEENAIFNRAMASLSGSVVTALVSSFDFAPFATVADIGGGNGSLLAALLAKFPNGRGHLYDQPHVVAQAKETLDAAGVSGRCQVEGGDFFVSVPAGADAYLLKSVLHDWDDASAIRILRNVRAASAAGAKLLVVERIVGAPNEDRVTKFSDLNMLVAPGGVERTIGEWRALLKESGFGLRTTHDLGAAWHVIEADPA
jgi:hypothetical protein